MSTADSNERERRIALSPVDHDNLLAAALMHAAKELRHAAGELELARNYFDPVALEDGRRAARNAAEALAALATLEA